MKALNVFKLIIFNILYFIYKCKQNLNPRRTKTKHVLRNKIIFKNLYAEQVLVSNAFHTVDPIIGTK